MFRKLVVVLFAVLCLSGLTFAAADEVTKTVACPSCGEGAQAACRYYGEYELVCIKCGYSDQGFDHLLGYFKAYDNSCSRCCLICGYEDWTGEHYADCDAEDTSICTRCKAENVQTVLDHESEHIKLNDSTHAYRCTICDYVSSTGLHYAYCDAENTSTCRVCKAENVQTILEHCGDEVEKSDIYQHWYECSDCGERLYANPHSVYCDDKTTCRTCGQTDCNYNSMYHYGDIFYRFDDIRHYEICSDCEDVIRYMPHYSTCNTPDVCDDCGAEGITSQSVRHLEWEMQYSDTEHWEVCLGCGEVGIKQAHYAYCDSTAKCRECKTADCTLEIYHTGSKEYAYDTNEHWKVCTSCDQEIADTRAAHTDECPNIGSCTECGAQDCCAANGTGHSWQQLESTDPDTCSKFTCTACGKERTDAKHSAWCNNATTCYNCGAAELAADSVNLFHENFIYRSDKETHWQYCTDCKTDLGNGQEHDIDWNTQYYNEEIHWNACSICGFHGDSEYHTTNCLIDARQCDQCDYVSPTAISIRHHRMSDAESIRYDADGHWSICEYCDEIIMEKEPHISSCANPTLCIECKHTFDNTSVTQHVSIDWSTVYTDATHHWYKCLACGNETQKTEHMACCSAPTKCDFCQMEGYTGSNMFHSSAYDKEGGYNQGGYGHESDKYTWQDLNSHNYLCAWCDATLYTVEHVRDPQNSNKCKFCKGDVGCEETEHNWGDGSAYADDDYHYENYCTICGKVQFPSFHEVHCSNNAYCTECNHEVSPREQVWHMVSDELEHDDQKHWEHCSDCGMIINYVEHFVRCSEGSQTACSACGYESDALRVIHNWKYVSQDQEMHLITCRNCTYEKTAPHFATCADPDFCHECLADYAGSDIRHLYDVHTTVYNIQSNETHHWRACYGCLHEDERILHYTDLGDTEGVCSYCGVAYMPAATATPEPNLTPKPQATSAPTPVPMPDVTGVVVIGTPPSGKVKEPTLVLPEGTSLNTSAKLIYELTEEALAENSVTYEISFIGENGSHLDLPGECTLILPYPAGMSEASRNQYLVTIRHTRMDGQVDVYTSQESTVLFMKQGLGIKISSLSPFTLTWQEAPGVNDLPPTGDGRSYASYLVLLAVSGAIILIAKKKKA